METFIGLVSLAIAAWQAYEEYVAANNSSPGSVDTAVIIGCLNSLNNNLLSVRDQIIDRILQQLEFDIITELTGTFNGLQNQFAKWPVSVDPKQASEELVNIIDGTLMLEGRITAELQRCYTTNLPFRYAILLFGLYVNTMCFIFMLYDLHSFTYQSSLKDKKNFKELNDSSVTFFALLNNRLQSSIGPVMGPYVIRIPEDIPYEPNKFLLGPDSNSAEPDPWPHPGKTVFIIRISAYYPVWELTTDYIGVRCENRIFAKEIGIRPSQLEIDQTKIILLTQAKNQYRKDLTNLLENDPLLKLAIKISEIVPDNIRGDSHFKKLTYPKPKIRSL
jgi:hypothetical protein